MVIGSQGVSFKNFEINSWFLNTLNGLDVERLEPNLMVSDSFYTLGNAWFVNEVQYVDNANEEIDALHRIDPAKTAVVDKKFSAEVKSAAETDTLGTIKLTAYEPNDLKYEVNSKTGGTVVFSEIYYPGWQAYIDGVEAPHGRADYILRAMNVPAGKHVVEFKFDPKSLHVTETVAFVALGVLTCVLVLFLFLQVRRARRKID